MDLTPITLTVQRQSSLMASCLWQQRRSVFAASSTGRVSLEAIKFCLKEAGCTLEDVTAITIGRDPSAKRDRKARFVLKHPRAAWSMWSQRSANKDDIEKAPRAV